MYFVYIILCSNGCLYTGSTTDVARRFEEHRAGKGAKYTAAFPAVRLMYVEEVGSRGDALRRECEIKGWSREEKLALIRSRPKTQR